MSIPALQLLRESFPDAHIAIVARPWVGALYAREPFCDEIISYDCPTGWRGLAEKWALANQLRTREFDCAILFQNAFEAAALASFARIPERIGYARDGRSLLLTRAIPVPDASKTHRHQRFYYLELLKRGGFIEKYSESLPIRLFASNMAREHGRDLLSSAGLRLPVIGLAPGAAYGGAKRWLPERFAEAAMQLAAERDASVAIFGSRQERDLGERICERLFAEGIESANFCGTTTLSELIDMVAGCLLFLTNDSGPMHIASALGVPTVAVFGATDEFATGPTGANSEVVREDVECSPCLKKECPIDHRCMTAVSAERVVGAAFRVIDSTEKDWIHETK